MTHALCLECFHSPCFALIYGTFMCLNSIHNYSCDLLVLYVLLHVFRSDPCTENEVRLNYDNMVQVCHDEKWGLVCAHEESWNLIAADVVCKQVGILSRCQLVTLKCIIY